MEKKRCFIALDLSKECLRYLQDLQQTIAKENICSAKFTEQENIHLTLKFLGEINEEKLAQAQKQLQKVRFNKFPLTLQGIGVFSEKFIRIIWVQVTGKKVYNLQKKIDASLELLFPPEHRFMGHITIARVKKVEEEEKLLTFLKKIKTKKRECSIDQFTLKQSSLTEKKAVYSTLKAFHCRNL